MVRQACWRSGSRVFPPVIRLSDGARPPGRRLGLTAMPQVRSVSSVQHRLRRSNPMIAVMRASLARTERMGADELRGYQERRLRALVPRPRRRSPFYRDWFAGSGVDPALDPDARPTWAGCPCWSATTWPERPDRFLVYPRRRLDGALQRHLRHVVTVYRTAGSSVFELSALQRQWSWFGCRPAAQRGAARPTSPAPTGGGRPEQRPAPAAGGLQLPAPNRELPGLLAGDPGFGPRWWRAGPPASRCWPRCCVTRGETAAGRGGDHLLGGDDRRAGPLMREVFGGPVMDHYGQTERVAMAGGCEAGGYHLFPDYGITELLPVPGRSDSWEIVGTPLHNWGFPLFRYRTGDEVGPAPAGPAPAGGRFPPSAASTAASRTS